MTTQPPDLKKLRAVRNRMSVLFPEEVTVDDLNAWTNTFDSLLGAYEASAMDADETLWKGYLFLMHNVPFFGKEESIAAFRREIEAARHATQGD